MLGGALCPIVDLCSLVIICLVDQLPRRTDERSGMNVHISSVSVYRLRSSRCAVIRGKHKDFSSVSFVNSVHYHPEAIVSLFCLFVYEMVEVRAILAASLQQDRD